MNIKEPDKEFFDDFEHKVTNKISKYKDQPNFPKLGDYGIDPQDFDGYLFDKQAILDMGGSRRTKLTIGGIVTVFPVICLSALPDDQYIFGKMWTTVFALVIGLMLSLCIFAMLKAVIYYRLGKLKDPKMESYIKAVLFYQPHKS